MANHIETAIVRQGEVTWKAKASRQTVEEDGSTWEFELQRDGVTVRVGVFVAHPSAEISSYFLAELNKKSLTVENLLEALGSGDVDVGGEFLDRAFSETVEIDDDFDHWEGVMRQDAIDARAEKAAHDAYQTKNMSRF